MPVEDEVYDFSVPNLLYSGSEVSSFACEHCKAKKIKCDKVAPRCTRCLKSGRACQYPASVPKPGPKTASPRGSRHSRRSSLDRSRPRRRAFYRSYHSTSPENQAGIGNSISAIVHPLHDTTTAYPHGQDRCGFVLGATHADRGRAFSDSLSALNISNDELQTITDVYFANMTALSLFHRPTFHQKLRDIGSAKHVEALLTSISAFTRRSMKLPDECTLSDLSLDQTLERALRLTKEALGDYIDEAPPLHLLQSLILTTWLLLCKGVRGRAWRLGGECVRIAYELKLHVDVQTSDEVADTVTQEERRRAWWAVWEFDVFSSTIKRLPSAIDRSSCTTRLPVSDTDWFASVDSKSCPLALDLNERWKLLEKSGNESGWAWFICFNSYKLDTHILSVAPNTVLNRAGCFGDAESQSNYLRGRHETLFNCLHCARLALPERLNAQGRVLSFEASSRHDDAWSYSILFMGAVTRYLLHRVKVLDSILSRRSHPRIWSEKDSTEAKTRIDWGNIVNCARECALVLRNTTIEHVKFVNPCLSNSVWFMASALLLERTLGPTKSEQPSHPDFDLLRATIVKFVKVCNVPRILLETLDTMEDRLRGIARPAQSKIFHTDVSAKTPSSAREQPDFFAHDETVRNQGVVAPSSCDAQSNLSDQTTAERLQNSIWSKPQPDLTSMDIFGFTPEFGDWDFDMDLFSCPFE